MKFRRNLLQIWLLCAAILPAVVQAQFTFTTNNGAITITGYTGSPTVLIIPSATNGYPVTSIASNAFLSRLTLTSVTIPDTVTNIGIFAFDQCSGMTNFTFGSGLTTIGIGAFIQCLGLTSITIPNNVTTIGDQAFSGCHSLANFTFGSGVTTIGSDALNGCSTLTSITVPNNVTNVGAQAFGDCSGLTNIIIGSGVTSIGGLPLYGCGNLTSATVGVPNIDGSLFSWVGGVDSFPSLTGITLLDSVTNIGDYAFVKCQSLSNVTIGSGVNSIGTGVFPVSLLAVNVDSNNTSYCSVNGVLFNASQSTLIQYPPSFGATSYTVPNSVTNIGSAAFKFSFFLTKIYFMVDAPSYGASAFDFTFATVYYLPETTGWGTTFAGLPTAPWLPQIQTSDGSFGVQSNQFGFDINWASGQVVVVEASASLVNPVWFPVETNTLTGGSSYFSDPQWTNYPNRFYRVLPGQ